MKQLILFFASIILFTNNINAHSKDIIDENRKLPSFSGVEVSQGISVIISAGEEQLVTVSANEEIMSSVITEVQGGVLKISIDDRYKKLRFKESPVRVTITMQKITSLIANTKSNVVVSSSFDTGDNLSILGTTAASIHLEKEFSVAEISIHVNTNAKLIGKVLSKASKANVTANSSGEVTMNLEVEEDIECSTAGKGKIILNGKANNAQLSAMSFSEIRMRGFETKRTNAVAMTSAQIQITVHDLLAATAASNALINYWGKPKSVDKETTTGGRIR